MYIFLIIFQLLDWHCSTFKNLLHCVQHSVKSHKYLYIYLYPYVNRVISFTGFCSSFLTFFFFSNAEIFFLLKWTCSHYKAERHLHSASPWQISADITTTNWHKNNINRSSFFFIFMFSLTMASAVKSKFIMVNNIKSAVIRTVQIRERFTLGKMFHNTLRAERNSLSELSLTCVTYECDLGVFPTLYILRLTKTYELTHT